MGSTQDWQLLKDYVEHDSQAAFSALVERHLNLVYATCLREVRDVALAEDVTQVVFLLFARKAATLNPNVVLSGWFFQTARYAAKNARRREARWQQRNQEAMQVIMEEDAARLADQDTAWAQIEPLLHESLAKLNALERNAILLRCFEGRSLKETGAALGLSEEAARKRVTRGIDKMRRDFTRRGVTLSVVALAGLLSARAVQAAPLRGALIVRAVLSGSPHAMTQGAASLAAKILSAQAQRSLFLNRVALGSLALCSLVIAFFGFQSVRQQSLNEQRLRAPPPNLVLPPRVAQAPRASPPNDPTLPPLPTVLAVRPPRRDGKVRPRHQVQSRQKETTPMKTPTRIAAVLSATALMSASALADTMNARISAVDPAAHTITVVEKQTNYTYFITPGTKFTNAQGDVLAVGYKMGDKDTLEVGVKSGALKPGTRLSITYHVERDKSLATEVKLRDKNREEPKQ